jgi:hypothetical protein
MKSGVICPGRSPRKGGKKTATKASTMGRVRKAM